MRGEGRIVANDANRIRFYKLRSTVEHQGAFNVDLSRRRGEQFGQDSPEAFDRVLVDAPCGTEGRFYTGRASSYTYWRVGKIHEMVIKQRHLLLAGARALRPEGTLVYSTCTFAPEENEGVVHWLLEKLGGVMELEALSLPIANTMPGLPVWDHRVFDATLARTVRILPTPDMEAFFIAKFRKHSSRA